MPRIAWPSPISFGAKSVPYGLTLILGALGYFVLARLGLSLASLHESASPVWPASGFALALLITRGRQTWPAIALGAFCADALTGGIGSAIPITAGSTLAALLGHWIFHRIAATGSSHMLIARSAAITAAALIASLVSAAISVVSLAAGDALAGAAAAEIALTWWAGDVLGILLLTPPLLALHQAGLLADNFSWPQGLTNLRRFLGLLAAALAASAVAFLQPGWGAAIFLAFPVILFAARWFGQGGSSFLVLVTASLWLAGTMAGLGPFVELSLNDSLLDMQIMLAALAIAGLVLAQVAAPRLAAADLVFLIGSLVAAVIFLLVTQTNADVDEHHFDDLIARISGQFDERMGLYVTTLQGGASLYAASREVRRAEWRSYVSSLDLFTRHPGINSIGIIVPADVTARASFIAAARKDGMPDFDIKPMPNVTADDTALPQHFVILYAEPMDQYRGTVGLDIASDPNRRTAAITARDTRTPTITAPITLTMGGNASFLLFVPMYREPVETLSAAGLRWSFHGWVYASFAADTFFRQSMPAENPEVRLQVFDDAQLPPAQTSAVPLFDSGVAATASTLPGPFAAERETQLHLYGRTYTLRWQRSPDFATLGRLVPIAFSAGLILLATLLAALTAALMSQKEQATAAAQQVNAALAASNERFALAVACSQDGVWDYDIASDTVWTSPRYKEIYGYDESDITDHWAFRRSIMLPEDYERSRTQYDEMICGQRDGIDMIQRYRHKQGHIVHIHSRALAVRDRHGKVTRVIGVHTDITVAVKLEQQLKSAINAMTDGFGIFDADDRVILFNDAFIDGGTRKVIGDPTGCKFEEILRAFAYHDMPVTDPDFDRDAWIAARLERHRNPPEDPIEVQWGDGRWMRISERRTPDGGYVGVWGDITEIKRIGQRLREAIDALSDAFALFDADDKLVICNKSFMNESMRRAFPDPVGHTFEEFYRVYAREDLGLTDPAECESWLRARVQLHRQPPDHPYEIQTPDGQSRRILERRTSDGGTVGIWSDTTSERAAQRRLQDAISSLPDGFALFDAQDKLVVCNERFRHLKCADAGASIVGLSMAAIIERFTQQKITGVDAGRDSAAWAKWRLNRHQDPPEQPYEQELTDGRWFSISERKTSDGGVVGVWTDITALKIAERRLHDAVESINEGFMLLDAEGRYAVFNQELLRLYPKTAPIVRIGGKFEDALRYGARHGEYPEVDTPEKIEAFIDEWMPHFRDPTPFQREGTFADGRWVLVSHHGTSDGGSVNIYTDITTLKTREADLAAANAQLERQAQALTVLADDLKRARLAAEEANISKSLFLANMSHELRTPLNGIIGFAEIIDTEMFGSIEPYRYQEYGGLIRGAGTHLLALINDILDLSKIEANKMVLNVDAVATADLVTRSLHLVAKMAAERQIAITATDIDTCPVVHADETQARQILLNLLSNAVKFTPSGGHVTLRVVDEGEAGAAIIVADTGIGMTPADIEKALERFGQAEASFTKTIPGTGLGLPLVEALTKLHGGRLEIASEKGKGTVVTVHLPWHPGLYRAGLQQLPA